jgi:predicted small lipoprotein YifL
MRVVFRMSAIVTALTVALAGSAALTGCGNRGPLYLPTVPPLPAKPNVVPAEPSTGADSESADERASDVDSSSAPAARAPLTLAPAGELAASAPRANRPSPATSASKPTDQ